MFVKFESLVTNHTRTPGNEERRNFTASTIINDDG